MRGSIFAKVGRVASGHLRSRDCSSLSVKDAITNEEAKITFGLMMRALCVKGMVAYFGYKLGCSFFSPQDSEYHPLKHKERFQEHYDHMLQQANDQKQFLKRLEAVLDNRLINLVRKEVRLEEVSRRNNLRAPN